LLALAVPDARAATRHARRPRPYRREAVDPDLEPRSDHRRPVGGFLPSMVECTVRAASLQRLSEGLNLDCDPKPNNEPEVAVDPADPLHAVVSSNDYDSCCDGFSTTFDGGLTWRTGDVSSLAPDRFGSDPVTSFDRRHRVVLHASLSFTRPGGIPMAGDVVVSASRDGGVTWGRPVVVAVGQGGASDPVSVFNDKEWMATDTNAASPHYGRTYVTWSRFTSRAGLETESPIWEAHSDDGGSTWSEPHEISGASTEFCTFAAVRPGRCDQDQDSNIAVGPDGTVFVAFQNFQHDKVWQAPDEGDSQYLVVRSTDGGRTFSAPVHVADLENGRLDYPANVKGRPTLTGTQVQVNSAGNLAVDRRTGALSLVFSDNRAGRHGEHPVTDVNVYLMTSPDGVRWSGPIPVATGPGDQWFPWAAVDPGSGDLAVVYNDGDAKNPGRYGVSVARGRPGAWRTSVLAPALSDLGRSLFFWANVPGCEHCATFHGDYIGIDFGSDGRMWAAWTDMREVMTLDGRTGHEEHIYLSRR
jgi:hypothetical protein